MEIDKLLLTAMNYSGNNKTKKYGEIRYINVTSVCRHYLLTAGLRAPFVLSIIIQVYSDKLFIPKIIVSKLTVQLISFK